MNETTIDISKSHDESIYMQYIAMAVFIGGMYIVAMVYMRCCGNIPEEEISFENHRENNNITIDIVDTLPVILPDKSILPKSKYFQRLYVQGLVIDPFYYPICLEDMQEENIHLLKLRKCGHVAHKKCITEWVNTKGSDIRCLTCHKPV